MENGIMPTNAPLFHVFLFPKYPSRIRDLTKGYYYLIFNNNIKQGQKFVNL